MSNIKKAFENGKAFISFITLCSGCEQEIFHLHAITVPAMISGYISLYQNIFLSKALNTSCHHMSACTKIAVNYRQLQSRRLLMNACTFIKTFCSCSDTRNWYEAFSFYANRSVMGIAFLHVHFYHISESVYRSFRCKRFNITASIW